MLAYVFPGQGSQRKGMGEGLFEEFPDLTRQADEILGLSIQELCLKDPDKVLDQTRYTQPALFTVNALAYLKRIKDTGRKPDFLAGHSLGEYNALHAAGAISFETGLKLVKKRGELMSQAAGGGMAAVINLAEERIRSALEKAGLASIDIANFNSPTQIIISGLKEDINRAAVPLEAEGARVLPLNTSGAFHSRYMKAAAEEFAAFVEAFAFAETEIPVIANVTASPYVTGSVPSNLVAQIHSPVRWVDSVNYMRGQGVRDFLELGVGDVLTKLVAAILRAAKSAPAPAAEAPARPTEPAPATAPLPGAEADAKSLVEDWNARHPVGTRVRSALHDQELETRTQATVLFGHRAAVYLKGFNGYFDLREVKAA